MNVQSDREGKENTVDTVIETEMGDNKVERRIKEKKAAVEINE